LQLLTDRFNAVLKEKGFLQTGNSFLLAVSGGVDSVVLCDLAFHAGLKFTIAHCNFSLRGEESDRDEEFVRNLGPSFNCPVLVRKFDTSVFAASNKCSLQEAARLLRYEWFHQLEQENNFTATLLAHHANDNIETVLMNFFRGTGLEGLTGMKEYTPTGKSFRPMLSFTRKEIEAYARFRNINWVEDSSNLSSKYTRNFFRNEIIPAISKVYPEVEQNILDNIYRFRSINLFYQASVREIIQSLCEKKDTEIRIPVKKLVGLNSPLLLFEIFRQYGFGEKQVEEFQKLLNADSGKFIENEKYQVIRHGNWLVIAEKNSPANTIAIEWGMNEIKFDDKILHLSLKQTNGFEVNTSPMVAQLDAKKIEFPLVLRKWKQGDYFYPLGMRKKKKLGRFFIDQKLSKHIKESTWILESNKKIVWIVGMRIDDRFKVTPSTEQVYIFRTSSL
jgi:tRNA(Ile)-lysidine synthase